MGKELTARFIFSLTLLLLLHFGAAGHADTFTGTVTRIFDGDTVEIEILGKLRLLGIDTPEREDSNRDRFYQRWQISPRRLRAIYQQARRFNQQSLQGKRVTISYEPGNRDPYGRLLVYLYLPDGQMLNRLLLEMGLASVFRRYDFSLRQEFLQVEDDARRRQVGLWENPSGR